MKLWVIQTFSGKVQGLVCNRPNSVTIKLMPYIYTSVSVIAIAGTI
jgi:hypothetical protein